MKKLGLKGKMGVAVLAMALLFTGAVAGASAPGFSGWAKGALAPLIEKAAGWAGFAVQSKADQEEAAVKKTVNDEFKEKGNEVAGKTMKEIGNANKAIDDESKALQSEIERTAESEAANANAAIKAEIDKAKGSKDLDQAAKDELQKLINQYSKQIPNVPTK